MGGGSSVIVVLVPRAFQKYSTCMVYSDFLSPGKNSPLEGGEGGGPNTYCKFYPECFSVLNRDSQFQNFIEEFQCLQCMSNIGLLITFHTVTSGAICWPSSQAIPRFGNFYFEGSLVLEISILRDPSFWKFPF